MVFNSPRPPVALHDSIIHGAVPARPADGFIIVTGPGGSFVSSQRSGPGSGAGPGKHQVCAGLIRGAD